MNIIATLSRIFLGPKASSVKQEQPLIAPDSRNTATVGELQGKPMSAWDNSDIIKCLTFCATLQLRTPLRVLLRHGEAHSDIQTEPPTIAREGWEGIWMAQVFDTPYQGTMASDVGQVRASDYLPFLIAVRQVIETPDSIDHRIQQLRGMHIAKDWQAYLSKHGGIEGIISQFFPDFISTVPGINRETERELNALGLNTPNRLSATADKTLLGIKGIGPSKLLKIRAYCDGFTSGRDSEKLDMVRR